MLGTLIAIVLVLAVGTRASDQLRVRQQEVVLAKLPVADAHDYYQMLRGRARRVRLLRAIALVALLVMVYAYRRQLMVPAAGAPGARAAAAIAPTPRG